MNRFSSDIPGDEPSLIMLRLAFSQPHTGMFLFLGRRFALPQAMMKTGFQPVLKWFAE